jgi:predicted DNA binding CopG/RHH family protein
MPQSSRPCQAGSPGRVVRSWEWNQLKPAEVEVSPDVRRVTLRQSRKKPVTLRLEEQQIERAKKLARAKSLSYQALMRSWISEGIARAERLRKRA